MALVTITHPSAAEIERRGITSWPIWTKGISRFDWHYDQTEECLILDGEIAVETPEGTYTLGPGDFVTFAKGLSCVWAISRPVRKHYRFT
jgi:uncharacterized cupin superfamily protein